MSVAPVPKPRGSLKTQDEDDIAATQAQLGSPPDFKPPPPRPKNKPVAEAPSNNEPARDEYVSTDQIQVELDAPKDKAPVKNAAGRVAPPVPKSDQSPKSVTDSPKRPAPAPPKHSVSMDPSVMESKLAETPSTVLPSGPKHTRSISSGSKPGGDPEYKGTHSRNMSVDESSPKFTPKRVAPPPPAAIAKGDKRPGKPDEGGRPAATRSESCQSFNTPPVQSKLKELKPKDRRAPAVPTTAKQPNQSPKPPQKQSSFESQATKGAVTPPPQRASPKAPRKFPDSENKPSSADEVDGGEPTSFNAAKERIKKAGVALPLALLKEQAETKKKTAQQKSQGVPDDTTPTASSRTNEPTISYMDSPMAGNDDSSRKVKFSRQLKTWLTYASEEYDRANNVNVVQSAVLYELEKLIEKMHIYSVQLDKSM